MKTSKAIFLTSSKEELDDFIQTLSTYEPEIVFTTHPFAGTRATRQRRTILHRRKEVKRVKEWSRHSSNIYTDGGPK
jgi:hypothetical protein